MHLVRGETVTQTAITIRELLEAGAHYGHLSRLQNPKSRVFVYGQRNGISIIDLQKTAENFKHAASFIEKITAAGGHVLFVGTKRQSRELIQEHAQRCQQFYMNNRWLGGTLTNFPTIRRSIHKLKKIERMSEDGTFDKLTKKEALSFDRLREKLHANLGGIKNMPAKPHAIFITDIIKEKTALLEAQHLDIPVVAIVDTNSNPYGIDYPIPGNDDSIKSLQLFITGIADAALRGLQHQNTSKIPTSQKKSDKNRSNTRRSSSSFQNREGKTVKVERVSNTDTKSQSKRVKAVDNLENKVSSSIDKPSQSASVSVSIKEDTKTDSTESSKLEK